MNNPKVEISGATVEDVLSCMVGKVTPMKIGILLAAVNDCSRVIYTGVVDSDNELHGEMGNTLSWARFKEMSVKIGNIKL